MLCILCGAEMRLVKVEPDETMIVAGFEYHSFECTGCGEVERRLTFTRRSEPSTRHSEPAAEPVPEAVHSAPPVAPASPDQAEPPPHHTEALPPMGVWARAVARLRGRPAS